MEVTPILPVLRQTLGQSAAIPDDDYRLPSWTHKTPMQLHAEETRKPLAEQLGSAHYLTPPVVRRLNNLTRVEQKVLGYAPWPV